ncbi:hypothetical protein [Vibrio casei]|uniref:hypothetical protein n=1 Tax=Vibrio casei TaxID=673372 RepID=UPI003F9D1702
MKYSPLAIHCTSLCFDVIQAQQFKQLNHDDIDGFREDIYIQVRERTETWPHRHHIERQFVSLVTDGVICILHQCLNNPNARDSVWILAAIESRIDLSIKMLLQ